MGRKEWFIRLNTRTPRDYRNPPVTGNAQQAIDILTRSVRTTYDLGQMWVQRRPCVIYLRPKVHIGEGRLFRCFVKGGALIAISQCEGSLSRFPEERKGHIISSLQSYLRRVIKAFPYDDFVFDAYFKADGQPVLIKSR